VEDLRDRGFRTFGRAANRLLGAQIGFQRGFEDYAIRPRELEPLVSEELLELTGPVIKKGERLFAWAHFMAPHQPYEPPAQFQKWSDPAHPIRANNTLLNQIHRSPSELTPGLRKDIRALYDGEVAYATSMLGNFLKNLDRQYRSAGRGGLLENAVVVFFSDHGEELGDRNGYFLHAKSLYSGVTQVPLLVLGPSWEAGARISEPFSLVHLLPTVLKDVEPEWLDVPTPSEFTVSTWMRDFYAIRDSRWTLIHSPSSERGWGPKEPPQAPYPYPEIALYDRQADPLELHDLALAQPEQRDRLLQKLNEWFDSQEIRSPIPVGGLDPALLEELGYAESAESTACRPRSLHGR
jgi:arylsulfatase A-like enzyme